MKETEIIALYHRYWNVIAGEVEARAANTNYCRYCSHKRKCN